MTKYTPRLTDPRITELEELAAAEGFTLPMPAEMIVHFERQGRIVDLSTGKVMSTMVDILPTPSGKAVSYLLAHEVGEVAL